MNYDKVKRSGYTYYRYRHWDSVLKRYDATIYAPSHKELKQKVEEFEAQLNAGVHDNKIPFGIFCKNWLFNVHFVDKKPSTVTRYDSIYRNYIQDSRPAKIPLCDLNADILQSWYNQLFMKITTEKGPDKAKNCLHNLHKVVSPCIRYAFKTGQIVRNYAELVIIPKNMQKVNPSGKDKKSVHPLTPEEQRRFIEVIRGDYHEALFNTALDTGMRQGELFSLTWSDIDFEQNTIDINKTYSYVKDPVTRKFKSLITEPKTENSVRCIPLPRRTKEILLKHQVQQKKMLLPTGLVQNGSTLVFCTPVGTFLDSSNVLKKLKDLYGAAGISGKVFHDLRHTYATRLFELGEVPKTVQILLGHSDVNVTLGIYTHVLEELKEKSASKIDQFYEEISEKEKTKSDFVGQLSDNLVVFPKVSHF